MDPASLLALLLLGAPHPEDSIAEALDARSLSAAAASALASASALPDVGVGCVPGADASSAQASRLQAFSAIALRAKQTIAGTQRFDPGFSEAVGSAAVSVYSVSSWTTYTRVIVTRAAGSETCTVALKQISPR